MMKVILTAFNRKLHSDPIEFPDNTTPEIQMSMSMDVLGIDQNGEVAKEMPTMKKGYFRYTGKSFMLKDLGYKLAKDEDEFAKEYVLVDIRQPLTKPNK